jgi:hypothetical protein
VTAEEQRILAGIYRLLKTIGEQVTMLGSVVSRAHGVRPFPAPRSTPLQPETPPMLRTPIPEQGELPLAGCVLKCRPRIWGSTVNFYNEAWMLFKSNAFVLAELFDHREELTRATHGKVHLASFQRVLSALVRAGAATRKCGVYTLRPPTDQLREAVERVRNQKGGAK